MARFSFGGGPDDIIMETDGTGQLRMAARSPLTFWSDDASGEAYTDLIARSSNNTETTTATITTDEFGRIPRFLGPDGVTQMWVESAHLSDRRILRTTSLGEALEDKLDRDEPPGPHTHIGSDLPSVQKAADETIRHVYFNTTTNTWPFQADVTAAYPAVPIFWIGNATVPSQARRGLDYIDINPLIVPEVANPTEPPEEEEPPEEPEEPEEPVNGVTLALPTVTVSGANVTVSTTLKVTGTPQTFAYAQIAVRGPSGQNKDVGYRSNVTVSDTLNLSGPFEAPVSGTWTTFGTFNVTGGAGQDSWVDGPKKTFTVTIPTTPTPNPGGGGSGTPSKIADIHSFRSKMPWNSGAFVDSSGYQQWYQPSQAWFGNYRGRLSDVMLVFNDGAANWESHDTFYDDWKGWPGIFVWTIPPQPKSSGGNQATASGANDGHWTTVGRNIVNAGMNNNRLVLRLGHECNGNWYPWSWPKGGGYQTYVNAFKRCVDRVKEQAPNILVNICLNKDWSPNDWQNVLGQLKGHIDIVGLDAYDLAPGFRNSTARRNEWYNKPGPQRDSVAAWCRANGKLVSLDEWGLIASGGENGSGGGDDVLYITDTYEWCRKNSDILAYESYFMAPGNPGYEHELFKYPQAEAAYRSSSRWGNK